MKSAIGNALLINIILTFVVVMLGFLAGSLNYTKAFRVKNSLVNLIERENGYNKDKVDALLSSIGYKVVTGGKLPCVDPKPGGKTGQLVSGSGNGSYRYCIFKYTVNDAFNNRVLDYYTITTYMYFDIPLISQLLEFPVQGQTKMLEQ